MAGTIWDEALARIETKVASYSFHSWFGHTSLVRDDKTTLFVRVTDRAAVEWMHKHYTGVIAEALTDVGRGGTTVVFLPEGTEPGGPHDLDPPDPATVESPRPASPANEEGVGSLSPRYSFETFIVGASNQFAHAACLAVAEAPSRSYNPLFLYGGVGLGKTHLMHAIGHYILTHSPGLKLTYISAERFMNEVINAIRYDRILEFRERYRSVDILLVDDIQFIVGKERTQTEFFHTFNALHDSQKQIVLSSDQPPHQIRELEERLRSRFEWGLIADLQAPDLETKIAILKRKADAEGVYLPDDVALFIAGRIKSNIRELEGSLIRLLAFASLTGREISMALAQEALRDVPRPRRPRGDDRHDSEIRRRVLPVEGRRAQVAEQREVDRDAAAGGDVLVQVADELLAPGDWKKLRRQASLNRDPLDQKSGSDAPKRSGVQHARPQFDRVHPLLIQRVTGSVHSSHRAGLLKVC
jgi:chromosomal replication initiator protein